MLEIECSDRKTRKFVAFGDLCVDRFHVRTATLSDLSCPYFGDLARNRKLTIVITRWAPPTARRRQFVDLLADGIGC